MPKTKSKYDTRGWQINCKDYTPCPLCYGCRSYDSKYIKCEGCDNKTDKCNVELHTEKNIALMIPREVIDLDKDKK